MQASAKYDDKKQKKLQTNTKHKRTLTPRGLAPQNLSMSDGGGT